MKRKISQLPGKKHVLMLVIVWIQGISILYGQASGYGDIGVGGGLSYGGFGARLTFTPVEEIGLFGSLGYNLDALGYNLGAQIHMPGQKILSPYVTGMYGYNTVLMVDAFVMKTKTTYFGFSTGVGAEFRVRGSSFLAAEVLVPFRPQVYKSAIDDLESAGYEVKNPLSVAFCIGYHYKL